jgi:hypothetical protein
LTVAIRDLLKSLKPRRLWQASLAIGLLKTIIKEIQETARYGNKIIVVGYVSPQAVGMAGVWAMW